MSKLNWLFASIAVIFAGCSSSTTSSKPAVQHDHSGAKTAGMDMPHDHMIMGAPGKLMVRTEPAELTPGAPTTLSMMVHDSSSAMVTNFDTVHEKKVHLISVSDDFFFFAHVHPDINATAGLATNFTFP